MLRLMMPLYSKTSFEDVMLLLVFSMKFFFFVYEVLQRFAVFLMNDVLNEFHKSGDMADWNDFVCSVSMISERLFVHI